jgi:hypothetical protein
MEEQNDRITPPVNPGYGLFQIAKALATSKEHPDPATRSRAVGKIEKWLRVLSGMFGGQLDVGSRTPVAGAPPWVTLEVATGGFATGNKLANGPLQDHERTLLAHLKAPAGNDDEARLLLNSYYISDEGLTNLHEQLRSGRYDVAIPEEGALLVVAWLVRRGSLDEARELLETLAPHFAELRFYPVPTDRSRTFGPQVSVRNVGETINALTSLKPNNQILAQKEAIQVWTPLYDRMITLFLETVEGETPSLRRDTAGARMKPVPHGRFQIIGGWPCKRYPEGWRARAQELVGEIERQRGEHQLCGRVERRKGPFRQLWEYLRRCIDSSQSLTGRDVGRVRLTLAGYIDKHGIPQSAGCRMLRGKQAASVGAPTFHEISRVLIPRLQCHPKDEGLDDVGTVALPVTSDEAGKFNIPAGTAIPASLERKLERCLRETAEVLVARGLITSGEVLARLLPQITAGLRAGGVSDPSLRRLYAAIYRAFRCRRSLLLLNLESQVRIEELPWVAAIDSHRRETTSTEDAARQTLEGVTTLTLCSFPHMILPNKLMKELRALAKGAKLDLPLVDELAADIFMGQFAGNFIRSAKIAARVLKGSLYETYFGIDYDSIRHISEPPALKTARGQEKGLDAFAKLCTEMAKVTREGWDVAVNGMIIEQQQIITTQNLAVLYEGLRLKDLLSERSYDLAQGCFTWVCRRQQMKSELWHAKLIMLKNTAYAWRQMVFFLSQLSPERVQEFLAWAGEHLSKQKQDYQLRFSPALKGLVLAADGHSPDEQGARRFIGWSKQRHWLLEPL